MFERVWRPYYYDWKTDKPMLERAWSETSAARLLEPNENEDVKCVDGHRPEWRIAKTVNWVILDQFDLGEFKFTSAWHTGKELPSVSQSYLVIRKLFNTHNVALCIMEYNDTFKQFVEFYGFGNGSVATLDVTDDVLYWRSLSDMVRQGV